jgi:hypothetical protein
MGKPIIGRVLSRRTLLLAFVTGMIAPVRGDQSYTDQERVDD